MLKPRRNFSSKTNSRCRKKKGGIAWHFQLLILFMWVSFCFISSFSLDKNIPGSEFYCVIRMKKKKNGIMIVIHLYVFLLFFFTYVIKLNHNFVIHEYNGMRILWLIFFALNCITKS